jgi:putative tributyrin esterase
MAITEIQLSCNNALRKMTSVSVILPEGRPGPFPVLYLLHGLTDDHTAWRRHSNVERYVSGLPLIVVMPNGERGWYTDSVSVPENAFETFITKDLIGFIDNTFRTIPTDEGRAVAGLSMGGYGATKLAIKYPDLFCAAASLSGGVAIVSGKSTHDESNIQHELTHIFGAHPEGGPEDIFALIEKANKATLPALHIDCGVDDFLFQDNRAFHAHLTSLGIPHTYIENPGEHNWDYWDTNIQVVLPWIAQQLGL